MHWCLVTAYGMPSKHDAKVFLVALLIGLTQVTSAKRRPVNTKFVAPTVQRSERVYFEAHFDSHKELFTRWTASFGRKQVNATHSEEYDGVWAVDVPGNSDLDNDNVLQMKSKGRHHAIAARFPKRFRWTNVSDLVVQYEAAFDESVECGGAYVKLLTYSANLDLRLFNDRTPYTIMFGPDKCDNHYKVHLIVRIPPCAADRVSPVRGHSELHFDQTAMYVERSRSSVYKHLENLFNDRKFHLYTLVIRQSGAERAFEIYIDQQLFHSAPLSSLKPLSVSDSQFFDSSYCTPPAAPSSTTPTASTATSSTAAEGVCEKHDTACAVGSEKPRTTSTPSNDNSADCFLISAIGLELFSLSPNIAFDNFIITDSRLLADQYARQTWLQKQLVAEYRTDFYSKFVYETVVEVTADMPWLWAVLLVFIVLPLLLLAYYFCCIRPQKILEEHRAQNETENENETEDEYAEEDANGNSNGCRPPHSAGPCAHDHEHRQPILKNAAPNAGLIRRRVRFADESPMRNAPFNEFDQEYALHDCASRADT